MARGSEAHGQGHLVGNTARNAAAEVPQSTLAAQIVNNLSTTNGQALPDGQGNLGQLLSEILGTGQGTPNDDSAIETDLNVNYKLVSVVTRAGLEVLLHDDPFVRTERLLPQAMNSISVIQLTIQRTPDVLFVSASAGTDARERSGLPMYIWLMPKLLQLLGRKDVEACQDSLLELLSVILQATTESAADWSDTNTLTRYCQACIGAILSSIEDASESVDHNAATSIFPPAEYLAEVASASFPTLVDYEPYQLFMRDSSRAAEIALHLISLTWSSNSTKSSAISSSRGTIYIAWGLDCLNRLRKCLGSLSDGLTWRNSGNHLALLFLRTTHSLASSALLRHQSQMHTYKVATSWAQTIATFLYWSSDELDFHLQHELSTTLLDMCKAAELSEITYGATVEFVVPVALAMTKDASHLASLNKDLQVILELFDQKRLPSSGSFKRFAFVTGAGAPKDVTLSDPTLAIQLRSLYLNDSNFIPWRSSKRRRISSPSTPATKQDLVAHISSKVYSLLGSQSASDLEGLHLVAAECFATLSVSDQCEAFTFLGYVACAGAGSLNASQTVRGRDQNVRCSICDSDGSGRSSDAIWYGDESQIVFMTLSRLLKSSAFQTSTKPRVYAMLAVKRIATHTEDASSLQLATSPLGQWCLQSQHSSLRELRIAAGKTLAAFLIPGIEQKIFVHNRRVALEFLRKLAEKNDLSVQETCVLAWGQVGRVSSDDELNIVLLRLIEYLGHTNPLVHGVAFIELSNLAQAHGLSPRRLLSPFWRSVGVTVVRDLQKRPQIAQLLCDLLVIPVADFLVLTQTYTLPYLVLSKKQDVLQRIAQARGNNSTVWSMCMDNENKAAILAHLLVQPSTDIESSTMSTLCQIAPQFKEIDLANLVKTEPIMIAFKLLNVAGDENEATKAQVYQAIRSLAALASRKPGQSRTPKKSDIIGPFFEAHVLGIMALFSDIINEIRGFQPTPERRRCLRGMDEMIRLAKGHISTALPQITACLQSALEVDDLRGQALATWATMMSNLDEEEVESTIASTFSIVVQNWEHLRSDEQQNAATMIGHLLKKHGGLIKANVNSLPSLASIPLMAKYEAEIGRLKAQMDTRHQYLSFSNRCRHENVMVVKQALVELVPYLRQHQSFLHVSAISEQPDPVISELVRSILDACVRSTETQGDVARLCAECIGLIGCLDPNRVEASREQRDMVVVSNFEKADETIDWVIFFLQEVLVKAFMSATNTRAQGFLAYAMQELLKFCDLNTSVTFKARDSQTNANYRRWITLPEGVRNTLTPFLTSKYVVSNQVAPLESSYPIFSPRVSHGTWLRAFVLDLLHKGTGDNARMLFPVCSRVIRAQDISIASFLLPFVALNVIVGGTDTEAREVGGELLVVLEHQVQNGSRAEKENLKLCSETVFHVLDYLSSWMQEQKKQASNPRGPASREKDRSDVDESKDSFELRRIEGVLSAIPAEVISRRAVECKSYARALFHWEQYIRQKRDSPHTGGSQSDPELEPLFERLQVIYTQIDEPDGIEGISAHLQVLNIDQQILEHRKAGRWTAAQSWYELQLAEQPEDVELQVNLLTCLKESGQHDVLLNQIEGLHQTPAARSKILPFAVEASWATGKWDMLCQYLESAEDSSGADFNVSIGRVLKELLRQEGTEFLAAIQQIRGDLARGLSRSATSSIQACHEDMLKFHVLTEIELLSGLAPDVDYNNRRSLMDMLERRLEILGAFLSDKQYLLGLRRAVMQLSRLDFPKDEIASAWLTSARLARKGNFTQQSFNAVLHASQLGAQSATIEHSRLLWKEGQHRKAIRSLEGAIAANAFRAHNYAVHDDATTTSLAGESNEQQNLLTARAHLLLAKWFDSAGQTQSQGIIHRYQVAAKAYLRWEKGHYYLGRHYNKLFESEKARPPNKQAQPFITGETAKLVIQSYLRSLSFGAKYIFQTLPRMLTLWLDLGFEVHSPLDPQYGNGKEFREALVEARKQQLVQVHSSLKKYIDALPAYMFYTALAQIVARICHPNKEVFGILQDIIVKVVSTHPQQALWTLLAVVKSSAKDRAARGATCLSRIKSDTKKNKSNVAGMDLKTLIVQGQKISAQLLDVCDGEIQGKPTIVSLTRDLGFTHKSTPCPLVVPLESTLTASLPTIPDSVKSYKAFARDTVTISSFLDDVLVLNSLQRPRKISVRGSDGKVYGLLCKPKDDLRKDQRLMEFNAMINRSLKRDAESSKRRLYIKTYAVTPLNEECGLIEWVDNLKTLRDILLKLYKAKAVYPNYPEIRNLLDEAASHQSKVPIFTKKILPCFPPVFHEWFVEMFPEPGTWFTARLKYTRSCAVMSMVGMVLGLGDRHGENILFEEGNGGTFHVDFNCLFDKGLTFEKPEMVPFRLTHNMVDAFGVYGYEGPFRKSCELTLQILRQNEDTLMTILETFVYDPTTDFIGKKKRTTANVPDSPQEVLDSVRAKVRGLLKGESVPLSVEGHVHELIQQATSPRYLAAMYIGWCSFF